MSQQTRTVTTPISAPAPLWLIAIPLLVVTMLPGGVLAALFDLTPVSLTFTAGQQRIPFIATADALLTDWTLWRRMHLVDWTASLPTCANVDLMHCSPGIVTCCSRLKRGIE